MDAVIAHDWHGSQEAAQASERHHIVVLRSMLLVLKLLQLAQHAAEACDTAAITQMCG